jgi:alpha-tubulin suppressor-like RCC1 family protein
LVPVQVYGGAEVTVGGEHTCTRSSHVHCWGGNGSGQLGDGTTTNRLTPSLVGVRPTVQITAGAHHTCVRTDVGGLKCWGTSYPSGQLGDGTTSIHATPVDVVGFG